MSGDVKPEPKTNLDDVDEVIGVAEALRVEDDGKLSMEELEAVGRELDIDAQFVRRAVEVVEEKKRADEQRAQREAEVRAAQQKQLRMAGIGLAVCLAVGGLGTFAVGRSTAARLRDALTEVETKRAQVHNVLERQRATRSQWQDAPASASRDAELSGAENRVRIERKRYDEAVARYNARATGAFASFWARRDGLPEKVPYSSDVTW